MGFGFMDVVDLVVWKESSLRDFVNIDQISVFWGVNHDDGYVSTNMNIKSPKKWGKEQERYFKQHSHAFITFFIDLPAILKFL